MDHEVQLEVVRCEVPQWPWTAEAAGRTARVQEVLGKAALGCVVGGKQRWVTYKSEDSPYMK